MRFQNQEMSLVQCERIQGISGPAKGSKPYDFYQITLVDGSYNKLQVPVPRSALIEGVVPDYILEVDAKNPVKVYVDIDFVPVAAPGLRNTYTLNVREINAE